MKKKVQTKKQETTIWDQNDPLEKALKAIAITILLAIFGFVIFSFAVV